LLVAGAQVVIAQQGGPARQPLVMAHGIRSGAETWDVAGSALFAEYPVSVSRKSTVWQASPVAQAQDLETTLMVGLPDSTLSIAHSGGGIVMRQAALDNAPMRGLLTIGSPNQGTPASIAITNGSMGTLAGRIFGNVSGFFGNWYFTPDDNIFEFWYWGLIALNMEAIGSAVTNLILGAMDFDSSYDVWASYLPGGIYQQEINSETSLATQAQNVPIRGFVRTRISDPDLALFRLTFDENVSQVSRAVLYTTALSAAIGSMVIASNYCGPNFDGRCFAAGYMGALSYDIGTLLQKYCGLSQDLGQASYADCQESDALIPFERQQWGPNGYATPYLVDGVSHTEQTKSDAVIGRMKDYLRIQGGLARCGQGAVTYVLLSFYPIPTLVGSTRTLPVVQNDACGLSTINALPVSATSSDPSILTVTGTGPFGVTVHAHAIGDVVLTIHAAGQTQSQIVSVQGF